MILGSPSVVLWRMLPAKNPQDSNHVSFRPSNTEYARVLLYVRQRQPVMLVGPTGCGKTTLVTQLASELGRPLITISGSGQTRNDLVGRYLLSREGTTWEDGPLTRAVKAGAIFYYDEIGGADDSALEILHPLLDHRRVLATEALGEIPAAPGFQFIAAYNPGYGALARAFTPAFRQRFAYVRMSYLEEAAERSLLLSESTLTSEDADFLLAVARITRSRLDGRLQEAVSTRLLLNAAPHLASGMSRRDVLNDLLLGPLTDDPGTIAIIMETLHAAGVLEMEQLDGLEAPAPRRLPILTDNDFFEDDGSGDEAREQQ